MPIEPEVATVAKNAAARLSDLDPSLPMKIEAALAARDESHKPRTFDPTSTAIAFATLVLAIVEFAYQFYRDRKNNQRISTSLLRERLRSELTDRGYSHGPKREKIIDAVVAALEDQYR